MPHDFPLLQDLLIVLVASVPIVFVCKQLRLPVIVGFMITGILIGPSGFRLIKDAGAVDALAEIGVVLLLFTVGLEFSLRRILEMKRLLIVGGGLQVVVTTLAVTGLAFLFNRTLNQAILFGFMLALSSTAIVLKSYIEKAEIDTPHGRAAIGILLFQDLCLVPMMLVVPILSGKQESSLSQVILTLGVAGVAIAVIVVASRVLVPKALYHIVRLRSPEVLVIFAVLISVGTSWVMAQFGLSLALGAFIAGLVLSESEYSHQVVADILPFRDVFNGIFFISIGMLLSLSFLAANAPRVLVTTVALILLKALIALAAIKLLGYSLRVSATAAFGIAQIGEFSFILSRVGVRELLLTEADYQLLLAVAITSMIATPFLVAAAPKIGYGLQSLVSPGFELDASMIGAPMRELAGHVVVVGYGLNGRNLSRVLGRVGVPYVALDLNPELVREAMADGVPIYYGDSTRREVLNHIGLDRARILVVGISDPIATRRTTAIARELNSRTHIIVRTRYMSEIADLYTLGADQVISEEFETSIEIFARVLREFGLSRQIMQREIEQIRREGYQMLREPALPPVGLPEIADALGSASTETLVIGTNDTSVGKSLEEMDLRRSTGATVIAVVRGSKTEINPGGEFTLAAGDVAVLLGSPQQIEMATQTLTGFPPPNVE